MVESVMEWKAIGGDFKAMLLISLLSHIMYVNFQTGFPEWVSNQILKIPIFQYTWKVGQLNDY